jgi:hypothetical protein
VTITLQKLVSEMSAKRKKLLKRLDVAVCGLLIFEALPTIVRCPPVSNSEIEFTSVSICES